MFDLFECQVRLTKLKPNLKPRSADLLPIHVAVLHLSFLQAEMKCVVRREFEPSSFVLIPRW